MSWFRNRIFKDRPAFGGAFFFTLPERRRLFSLQLRMKMGNFGTPEGGMSGRPAKGLVNRAGFAGGFNS